MSNLLVFHQGHANSGRLWCNALQDNSWQGDVQAPSTGMTASPSAVEFNGKVYCFHQGFAQSGELLCNVYDGMAWQGDFYPIGSGPHVSYSPSAVVFNNKIYCFFQGAGEDGRLYAVSSPDGINWRIEPNQPAPNTYLTHSPAAVVFNGQIYVFHQGNQNGKADGTMWYNIYDGNGGWTGDQPVPNTGMSVSPAAVWYNNQLYVFHQSYGETGELYFNVFDGASWQGDRQVPGTGVCMSSSPGLAAAGGTLYCFYQGAGHNGQLYFSSLANSSWQTVNAQVANTGMSAAPGALVTSLPPPPAAIVAPNPAEVRVAPFDGWGTSLCWWANQFGTAPGDYGAPYLADLIFGSATVKDPAGNLIPGLGINIVRYNIGGGGGGATIDQDTKEAISPSNPVTGCPYHYVQGFWKKWGPDPDEYDTGNPEYWDWHADANQRNMLTLARNRGANIFEFFSNSPPWWMCLNHSSSGGALSPGFIPDDLLKSNLQSWNVDKFARYLVTVVKYAREHWGIDGPSVQWSIEPFNEPDPPSWFFYRPNDLHHPLTWSYSGQEGCNFGCDRASKLVVDTVLQQDVIDKLYDELNGAGLNGAVTLTASDWNSIDYAVLDWRFLTSDPSWQGQISKIEKVNVHGYDGTSPYRGAKRAEFREKVRNSLGEKPKIWMSEYGDDDHSGMTMAMSIMLDMTELQPSAWVLWQVIDPSWGLLAATKSDDALQCPDGIGGPYASYYVFAQFSRHVRQGCKIISEGTIIGNDDGVTRDHFKSIAAYDPGNSKLVIVTLNLGEARWITYDLSKLPAAGPVGRWETTGDAAKKYSFAKDVVLAGNKFRLRCDPNSVNTFEIQGVTL
jgi:galactan endo-1,6-beta-galactosidase